MVDIGDIPDFPGLPGQRPQWAQPPATGPVTVTLVSAPLDKDYQNVALNRAAVDQYITAQVSVGNGYVVQVERWDPWSDLKIQLPFSGAAFNYGRFELTGRTWYGFLDMQYLNLTDTVYTVTPDYWTSFEPVIGYSMIRRGHVAVAASSAGDVGYCLEPENLPTGDLIGYASYLADPLGTPRVLVISTTDLNANPFVTVDPDLADTNTDIVGQTLSAGTIDAPQPIGSPQPFAFAVGNNTYNDLFFYPYTKGPGTPLERPVAFGAVPSLVDGVLAEGGAFIYGSIGAAATHLSWLAHSPWISDGIQRVLLIPGGAGGGLAPVALTPFDTIPTVPGGPSYVSSVSTEISVDVTVAANWTAGLPGAYGVWTKLRTGPFSGVQIADRQGSVSDFDPQSISNLNTGGVLQVHMEGVFHPEADVVAWITGAGGAAAGATPTHIQTGADMPHFAVGRDSVLAAQAAGIAAERSQSAMDMLLALQKAQTDRSFTLAAAFTSTQYAIAEAI